MPDSRSRLRVDLVLALVVVTATGCSATSSPQSTSHAAATDRPSAGPTSAGPATLPPHHVVAGPQVAGAFDLATDGRFIAWSTGTIDVDAPELWVLNAATARAALLYRSPTPGAILANLAVREGTYAFAELTPVAGGSKTWRLVLLDRSGRTHVLDTSDIPAARGGFLPMAAISDRGVLWAVTHLGDATSLRCDMRYAALSDLAPRILASEPCAARESWFPRSDGQRFVYGTVEYQADGSPDLRHVYLLDEADLAHPRRLDANGQASMPAILGDTVVWKAAPTDLNMFAAAGLEELDLAAGSPPRAVPFPAQPAILLTMPTIGPGFIVGEEESGVHVTVWDRDRSQATAIESLDPSDPGFVSGTRLAGNLLAWFYTSSTQGGGTREIRWLTLPP